MENQRIFQDLQEIVAHLFNRDWEATTSSKEKTRGKGASVD